LRRHRLARTGKFAYPHEAVNHEGTDDMDGCGHAGSVVAWAQGAGFTGNKIILRGTVGITCTDQS
jgi:hypothetical protein